MPQGIRVFNADGSLQFDVSNRAFRVLTVQLVSANGSYTSAELAKGDALIGVAGSVGGKRPPVVTRSGNTVSWSYDSIPVSERDTDVSVRVALY